MAPFIHAHRVTYSECTVGNHVYYARYLDFFEEARGELFRSVGITMEQWQQRGFIFPVIECLVRYRTPAAYDEILQVEVRVMKADGVRLGFGYRISNAAGHLVVEAETTHACTNLESKPQRLPEELRQLLSPS